MLFGALVAAFAAGAAGFAFAVIGMAIWLHALPPARAVPLAVSCSLILNLALIWPLRADVDRARLAPFLAGALIGVPVGIAALHALDPEKLRFIVGCVLIGYSLYMFTRRDLPVLRLGPRSATLLDSGVGAIGGFMGGATSLNGVFPALWSGLRGWSKREQRGVFQPYILLVHLYTLLWLGGIGGLGRQAVVDLLWCLPVVAFGGWLGFRFYQGIPERTFTRLMLGLFFVSGVMLLI